jgi:hypothetical protein
MIDTMGATLGRYQFWLSLIIIGGYFGLLVGAARHALDLSFVREVTPLAMIVVVYWFQRQRHQSASDSDGTNGKLPSTAPAAPTSPTPAPAQSQVPAT